MYNYKIYILKYLRVCVCMNICIFIYIYIYMYTFNVLKIYIKIVKLLKYMENKSINGKYH